jgi:hypothetical protein
MLEFGRLGHGDPEFWKPAALIDRLVADGGSLQGVAS